MQVATAEHVYVFDGIEAKWNNGEDLQPLKQLLTAPEVLKCGVGITNDVSMLLACAPDLQCRCSTLPALQLNNMCFTVSLLWARACVLP